MKCCKYILIVLNLQIVPSLGSFLCMAAWFANIRLLQRSTYQNFGWADSFRKPRDGSAWLETGLGQVQTTFSWTRAPSTCYKRFSCKMMWVETKPFSCRAFKTKLTRESIERKKRPEIKKISRTFFLREWSSHPAVKTRRELSSSKPVSVRRLKHHLKPKTRSTSQLHFDHIFIIFPEAPLRRGHRQDDDDANDWSVPSTVKQSLMTFIQKRFD